ncbi:MAG: hypothetical protein K0S11_759 [Gammaproteobacteria bacterium]|jgi:hypothetical protein|nr:hypothetical protein [Gammaproteobacteria bacterium]
MKKLIALLLLQLTCVNNVTWACSHKEQVHIIFTGKHSNVSHAQISSVGKWLFANDLLAKELHSFTIDTNHAKGLITFDIDDQSQRHLMLEEINHYLKQNDLKLIRVSREQLLKSPE